MIYLLSSELNALEEISKLCGDVKVKGKGKDKPDETRPLISVSDLQRLAFKDAIIKKQRQDPFKTKLKGVNEYNWNIPKYEKAGYPSRTKLSIDTFDLRGFVKEKKKSAINESMMMNSPMARPRDVMPRSPFPMPNPMGMNEPFPKMNDDEFDVDELIKKIDAKIAELEKEEEENKAKLKSGSSNAFDFSNLSLNDFAKEEEKTIAEEKEEVNNDNLKKIVESNDANVVKINEDIDDIIKKIEEEDVSDDQFFDDFFFDE
jgi:hypothetical protein